MNSRPGLNRSWAATAVACLIASLALSGCNQTSDTASVTSASVEADFLNPVRIPVDGSGADVVELKVGQSAIFYGLPVGVAPQIEASDTDVVSVNQANVDDTVTVPGSTPGPGFTALRTGQAAVSVWRESIDKGDPLLTVEVRVVP